MISRFRSLFYLGVGSFVLGLPGLAHALEFLPGGAEAQFQEAGVAGATDPVTIVLNIISIVFAVSLIVFIYAGVSLMISGGNPSGCGFIRRSRSGI